MLVVDDATADVVIALVVVAVGLEGLMLLFWVCVDGDT